jgi:DNA-binding transcriptional LysR family regulator
MRTTRRLTPTDDGRLFYDRAKSILGEFKEIELSLSARRGKPTGRLRVSAPLVFSQVAMGKIAAGFVMNAPRPPA